MIRNKVEHSYEVPKINDLEVYFDLVYAFITILERLTAFQSVLSFDISRETNYINGNFHVVYIKEEPSIKAELRYGDESKELVVFAEEEIEDFAYFFKTLVVLSLYTMNSVSLNYVASQLGY